MKKIIKVVLIIAAVFGLAIGTIYLLGTGETKNISLKNTAYPQEVRLIEAALNKIVTIDCDGIKTTPWYCNQAKFELEKIEPFHELLYAAGKGKTRDNNEFYWIAAKTKGFWGTIYFENTNKSLPSCSEIADFPADIFDQKLRFCIQDEQKIDRL